MNENKIFGDGQDIDLGGGDLSADFDPFADTTEDALHEPSQTLTESPADDTCEPVTENPLTQALAMAETKEVETVKGSLFSRLPKFEYAGVSEDIADTSKTFEDLRNDKSQDFPELQDQKRVSWSVEYGKITKPVADPQGTSIGKMKTDIEKSKEFLDALKKIKADDREKAVCKVKPRITAQSKGEMASYKGFFPSPEAAQASDKIICFVPSRDGKLYEMRKTDAGVFTTPAGYVADFSLVIAGFIPALPLIPMTMLHQIVTFFRSFLDDEPCEALVHILWDRELRQYEVHVPQQIVSRAAVHAKLEDNFFDSRYIHVMDIHSHNQMAAKFSVIDDHDEQATRLYAVIGHLERYWPEISVRFSNGGKFMDISPRLVFEDIDSTFPADWALNVSKESGDSL